MLEAAIVAARLAGQRAMEELSYIKRTKKSDNELVTQADPICQKIIINHLREKYPDHGFIAEEGESGHLLHIPPRSGESIWWIIDPIDGTNNYANGLLSFCVSIAAMMHGKPIVGVIFDPATDSMYTAAQDMEAQLNGSRITVNESEISTFSSFAVDSHSHPDTDAGFKEIMSKTRFRCLGSTALHMAYVAKGALIGMATTSARLWDIAAGVMLIQQAGGIVTDLKGNSPFPVDLATYKSGNFHMIGSNRKIHSVLLKIF